MLLMDKNFKMPKQKNICMAEKFNFFIISLKILIWYGTE